MSARHRFSAWKKNHHLNHRRARFEQLEDRRLLAMMANWIAATMPDSVAAEGVSGNTGT